MGGTGKDVIVSSFSLCVDQPEEDSDSGILDFAGGGFCPVDDVMTGGRGKDTFVFFEQHGNDVITDYFKDTIDLSALGLAGGFDDLIINDNPDGDAVIATGSGTITLLGVEASEVDADYFVF